MSDLRRDPITRRWIIIDPDYETKPISEICPFCEGNESYTPKEILAYSDDPKRKPNTPRWLNRVIPNKYPILSIEGNLDKRGEGIVYDTMKGVGANEIIIETPNHESKIFNLENRIRKNIFKAIKERIIDLTKDKRFEYILPFKNYGIGRENYIKHPHSELIATTVIPNEVQLELNGAESHYGVRGRCIYCDIKNEELNQRKRTIDENEYFLSFEPYFSKKPFETWIIPLNHEPRFSDILEKEMESLASIVGKTFERLHIALKDPPYNWVLHSSPLRNDKYEEIYHWHLEIIPLLDIVGGFERGSGINVNSTYPEEAAAILREVDVS